MAIEIERKFLVSDDSWRMQADDGVFLQQGYLASDRHSCVRVRLAAGQAWLAVKQAVSPIRRLEYEYPIPEQDARELLAGIDVQHAIGKTRYRVEHAGHVWELDVYTGANAGLVIAEIELDDEQEKFVRPSWLGEEVSDDPRYYDMNLASLPYPQW
ncbi:MAG TPA: CYTH domain-containing protein [Gammaproteobacteria bacterium]|nr:CYTH domain-containing protein [Gammaproteobacteria bacterium]